MFEDWTIGTIHLCKLCKIDHDKLEVGLCRWCSYRAFLPCVDHNVLYILYPVKYHILGFCAQAHVDERKGGNTERQRRVTAWMDHTYMFLSYNPAVTQLYSQRFPWIGARNLVVVCTRKTAMTLGLVLLRKRFMTTGEFVFHSNAKMSTPFFRNGS